MDNKQGEKLERYFKNANRFLWGLIDGNQAEIYSTLKHYGFGPGGGVTLYRGAYSYVEGELIREYGIDKIMSNLIKRLVDEQFKPGNPSFLGFLRDHWKKCIKPTPVILKANGFGSWLQNENMRDKLDVFLKYNKQYETLAWSPFAGTWFEEIEPYL